MTVSDQSSTSPFGQEQTSNDVLQPMQSPDSVALVASLEQKFDTVWKGSKDQASVAMNSSRMGIQDNDLITNDERSILYPLKEIRDEIFRLSSSVGNLSMDIIDLGDVMIDGYEATGNTCGAAARLSSKIGFVLVNLLKLADLLSIILTDAVRTKVELNCRKYPIHLCKGKSGKYTEYSSETGITKDKGQDTVSSKDVSNTSNEDCNTKHSSCFIMNIRKLSSTIHQFATDREWQKYHTPRNLLLALVGEVGELAELVQFRGDDSTCTFTITEIDKLGQELADVTIYLLRLADVCNIDLYSEVISCSQDTQLLSLDERQP